MPGTVDEVVELSETVTAASVAAERARQGLPPTVTDPAALAAVDSALRGSRDLGAGSVLSIALTGRTAAAIPNAERRPRRAATTDNLTCPARLHIKKDESDGTC